MADLTPSEGGLVKPSWLSEYASLVWDVLSARMVVAHADDVALAMACESWSRWREAVDRRMESGVLSKNSQGTVTAPWVGVEERAAREFREWCREFGLTPAARNEVAALADQAVEKARESGLDEFTRKLQERQSGSKSAGRSGSAL